MNTNKRMLEEKLSWLNHRLSNAVGADRTHIELEIIEMESILSDFNSNPLNADLVDNDYTGNANQLLIDIKKATVVSGDIDEEDYYKERNFSFTDLD